MHFRWPQDRGGAYIVDGPGGHVLRDAGKATARSALEVGRDIRGTERAGEILCELSIRVAVTRGKPQLFGELQPALKFHTLRSRLLRVDHRREPRGQEGAGHLRI